MARVLLTIGRLQTGGAELRTLDLIRALRQREMPLEITIYATSGDPGNLDSAFREEGAEVIIGRRGVRGLWEVFSLCRRRSFDVLHANASLAAGFYCFVAWLGGVPHRYSLIRTTGYDERGVVRAFRVAFYRLFLNAFSTRVIGVCNAVRLLAKTPAKKWLTIYNGIQPPPDVASIHPSGGLEILMLANVRQPKNPLKAVGIMQALKRACPLQPSCLR